MARTQTASRRTTSHAPRTTTRRARPNARSWTAETNAPTRAVAFDPNLQVFLDHFTQCLTAGDGQGAAACFEYPGLMVMSNLPKYGASQVLADANQVADFFAQAPDNYHARGIEETFANVEDYWQVADHLALVRVRFPYIDSDGNDMGDGETSLYVIRTGAQPRICAAVTLGIDSDRSNT